MEYGICNLSKIPLRSEPKYSGKLISELLFGDHFKVEKKEGNWLKIENSYDGITGWIEENQCEPISGAYAIELANLPIILSADLVNFVEDEKAGLTPILLGSRLPGFHKTHVLFKEEKYLFDGAVIKGSQPKLNIVKLAYMFLNTPYLSGGNSVFGIDASGFTQLVYKLNGYKLFRDVIQQSKQGEVLSFIEESEPGDLAFFDDDEGNIIHAGIILANNHIVHAHGKVRIDRLDQSGIFNNELRRHTHKLRVIKKIF